MASGAQRSRKHTVNVFRDLPDLIYRMLSEVSSMKDKMAQEIAVMKTTELSDQRAHHIMVRAIKAGALPASRLPKVLAYWEGTDSSDFQGSTAWALFNSFTALAAQQSPAMQMDSTLRLTKLFREELS